MSVNNWIPPTNVQPSDLHIPLPSGAWALTEYEQRRPVPAPGQLISHLYSDHGNREVYTRLQEDVGRWTSGSVGTRFERPNEVAPEASQTHPANGNVLDGTGQFIVEFRHRTAPLPSIGMPVRDILINNTRDLQGTNDPVFTQLQGRKLKFSIIWPGYKSEQYSITVIGRNKGPLTRFELVQQIAAAYASFISNVEKRGIKSTNETNAFPGPIALQQGSTTSRGVQLLHLQIVRFRGRIGGVWNADLEMAPMFFE